MAQWRLSDDDLAQIETVIATFKDSGITDDQGNVGLDNLATVFQRLDPNFTQEKAAELFSAIDKDNSGSIDIDEFFSFVFDLEAADQAARAHEGGLHASTVFCRIRPMAADGGHADGEEVEMKLDGWDEGSIKVVNRHDNLNFTFPKLVITPEKSQIEMFEATMPQFLDAWLMKCYNVQLLAYGQTGTGKTHTMFGTRESLSSDEPHPDWGLFPRVVHHALKSLIAAYKVFTGKWVLTASAVEFYIGQSFDLLGDKVTVELDLAGEPIGLREERIEKVSDLVPFLDRVNSSRTMASTRMNEGSSRSHCALILTLYATDHKKNELNRTTFTVVDLAGSERASKTGGEVIAPHAILGLLRQAKITQAQRTGMEGGMINFELSLLATEVEKATDCHQRKRRYVQPRGSTTTETLKFLGRSLSGECLMCMIVCISQAAQNGWETWFSCGYGESLAKLKAPLKKQKILKMDKAVTAAEKALAKKTKEVEDTRRGGAGRQKFVPIREAHQRAAQCYLDLLREITAPI